MTNKHLPSLDSPMVENRTDLNTRVDWFFGRGVSIGCGLTWSVPVQWDKLNRSEQIRKIKIELRAEMDSPSVNCRDIHSFFKILSINTVAPWRHMFLTTNWDYLIQREFLSLGYKTKPKWCESSQVFHLNGSIEQLEKNHNRSEFLLESDPATQRNASPEAQIAFNKIIWNKTFVVVGMSFECEMDRFLLQSLAKVQDDLPIGASEWVIVNPDGNSLKSVSKRINDALPGAIVKPVKMSFGSWLDARAPELQERGVLAF